MALNGMKIKLSGAKKVKSLLEQIGLGELWMKAHYADIGIVNMIRQRLKDIELQRWLSEINNDTRTDANQSNKMRTYRLFKTVVNRRYSYSPTALGRETSQHDCEAKAGNFLAKTQTNIC